LRVAGDLAHCARRALRCQRRRCEQTARPRRRARAHARELAVEVVGDDLPATLGAAGKPRNQLRQSELPGDRAQRATAAPWRAPKTRPPPTRALTRPRC
jgi:hypothetical protein